MMIGNTCSVRVHFEASYVRWSRSVPAQTSCAINKVGNPSNFLYIYIYLDPVCPLCWWFNPPKQGLFHSKQGSFGFQVYIYIYLHCLSFPKWVPFNDACLILLYKGMIGWLFEKPNWKTLQMERGENHQSLKAPATPRKQTAGTWKSILWKEDSYSSLLGSMLVLGCVEVQISLNEIVEKVRWPSSFFLLIDLGTCFQESKLSSFRRVPNQREEIIDFISWRFWGSKNRPMSKETGL